MARYGMVIDLKLCIGCNACTMACKAEHGTQPGVFWGKVLEKVWGKYPKPTRLFIPVLCYHCSDPLCVAVCPTGASHVSEEGLVLIDYDKCAGCRACIANCPYPSRTYVSKRRFYFPDTPIPDDKRELLRHEGVVQKCDFCIERLQRGEKPACVEICPTSCREFGDIEDPESEVSKLIESRSGFQLFPEKRTDPSVYYIR
jgi:molybdopterin-containing oxidoreductase family iron-sulfur binding subunit